MEVSRPRSTCVCHALIGMVFAAGLSLTAGAADFIPQYLADGFDYPVGKPEGDGYRLARGFYPGGHLGEDWNGNGGGDTDFGDEISCTAHGVVVYSDDFQAGWGNVIIIRHAYREKDGRIHFIDSLYGHLSKRSMKVGDRVMRGQKVGEMGAGPRLKSGRYMYYAHLHFEIRKNITIGMNRSKFPGDYSNFYSPRYFIRDHRRLRQEFRKVNIPVNTWMKENTNSLTYEPINIPDPSSPDAHPAPQVPEEVESVLEKEQLRAQAHPVEQKGLWERLKNRLGLGRESN